MYRGAPLGIRISVTCVHRAYSNLLLFDFPYNFFRLYGFHTEINLLLFDFPYISSACMHSIRKCFRRVLSIPFGIAFVAYKRAQGARRAPGRRRRPPLGPEGAQGTRRTPRPKGPLVPLAAWTPWPLASPWAHPTLLGVGRARARRHGTYLFGVT